jgi:hypothetical protein
MKRLPPVIGFVLALAVGVALGGLTVYFMVDGDDAPTQTASGATGGAADEPSSEPVVAIGTVVDEDGSAVPDAEVRFSVYDSEEELGVGDPVPLVLQFTTTADEEGRFTARLSPLDAGAVAAASENGGYVNFDAEVFLEDGRSAYWAFPRKRLRSGWLADEDVRVEEDPIRLVVQ